MPPLTPRRSPAAPPAARIQIGAGKVRIDQGSEVTSATIATGPAGPISINAQEVYIGPASSVRANTMSSGAGGTIGIHSSRINIDGGDVNSFAAGGGEGIAAPGPGGDVSVTAGKLQIINGGLITSSTINSGDGGKITIAANQLLLSGSSSGIRSPTIVTSQGTDLNSASRSSSQVRSAEKEAISRSLPAV